jgi:hypothetical protein
MTSAFLSTLNHLLFFLLVTALIISSVITYYSFSHKKERTQINAWQFPMLLALCGEQIINLFF